MRDNNERGHLREFNVRTLELVNIGLWSRVVITQNYRLFACYSLISVDWRIDGQDTWVDIFHTACGKVSLTDGMKPALRTVIALSCHMCITTNLCLIVIGDISG